MNARISIKEEVMLDRGIDIKAHDNGGLRLVDAPMLVRIAVLQVLVILRLAKSA
jgi:hypothetical protein